MATSVGSKLITKLRSTKLTTGVTALEVIPNAREVLIDRLQKIIAKAKELGDNPFNAYVIKTATYFLSVANKHEDPVAIEVELDMGQMEDVIALAEDQYDLMVYLNTEAQYKLWERHPEHEKEFREEFHAVFGDEEFQAVSRTRPIAPGPALRAGDLYPTTPEQAEAGFGAQVTPLLKLPKPAATA